MPKKVKNSKHIFIGEPKFPKIVNDLNDLWLKIKGSPENLFPNDNIRTPTNRGTNLLMSDKYNWEVLINIEIETYFGLKTKLVVALPQRRYVGDTITIDRSIAVYSDRKFKFFYMDFLIELQKKMLEIIKKENP